MNEGAPARVDVSKFANPFSFRNKAGRVIWGWVWLLLFRPSPRLLFGWRRFLLRCFGAKIGKEVYVHPSVRIWAPWNLEMGDHSALGDSVDCYCMDRVVIGPHATVSQYSYLCAGSHDTSDPQMRLITAPIHIGASAWICADVFVGPGVTIGDGAVAGARAVVVKDVEPWTIVAGNPAKFVKKRTLREGSHGEEDTSKRSRAAT